MAAGRWLKPHERDDRKKRRPSIGWRRRGINRNCTRIKTVWRWAEQQGIVLPESYAALLAIAPIPRNDARFVEHPRRKACSCQRSALLDASDKEQARLADVGTADQLTTLKSYRQALRDLPATVQRELDEINDVEALAAYVPAFPKMISSM